MKKLIFSLFIMFAVLQWTGCDFPFGSGDDDSGDWVAMTARIKEYRQIVLVDFNHPSKYRILTRNKHRNFAPKFSHDKKILVYESKYNGTDHNNGLYLLHVDSGVSTILQEQNSIEYNLYGGRVVWGANDLNIYYSLTVYGGETDILSYDFASKSSRRLTNTFSYSEYPVGFKGQDTLIVFSDDTLSTKQPPGFYYMDLSGRYLDRINNPHFEFIKRNELFYKKAAWEPDWSEELELFVYSQQNTTFRGGKITITNIDGSYYKMYTSGDYMDIRPVWGPGAKVIFFERNDFPSGNPRVMLLDLESERITQFVAPNKIGGATELSEPDY